MKTTNFDTYSDLIDNCLDLLEEKDSVVIFADYVLANEILQLIDLDEFKETTIEIDEDDEIDEYLITKIGDCFEIVPARFQTGKNEGELMGSESDYFILFNDVCVDIDEVKELMYGEIDEVLFDYTENDLDKCYDDGFGECDCPDCVSDREESCNEYGCCCDCNEIEDSTDAELRLIYEAIINIQEVYTCPDCLRDVITDLAMKFKNIGITDAKDYFNSCIEKLD